MNSFLTVGRMVCCLAVIMGLSFVVVGPAFCLEEHADAKDKRLNFEFRGQFMAEVAGLISDQLNYRVLMDDELAGVQVSGKFHDVTMDEFFSRRIFRGMNIAILFDDDQRMVTISSFGKNGHMTGYDRTGNIGLSDAGFEGNEDVTPGVKRRDVKPYVSNIDPMDLDVTPGVKRRDVKPYVSSVDPLDLDVTPGVKQRDVKPYVSSVDPLDQEVIPGVKRRDVKPFVSSVDPLDWDVTPGVKRRDVVKWHRE